MKFLLGAGVLAVVALAGVWLLNVRDEVNVNIPVALAPSDNLIARGAYLATAGNCISCHTARGGQHYAGGLGIQTCRHRVHVQPHARLSIPASAAGQSAHFWRAMHNGRSKSGRLLYPAFPYTSYTQVTREDSDAMFAFLRSLPAVNQPNRPHTLRFPFNSQAALAVWRALYFKPGVFEADNQRSAEWNPGRLPGHGAWAVAAPAIRRVTHWAASTTAWRWPVG